MITVRELIELLKNFNPNLPVFVASDAEGNSINALDELGQSFYVNEGKIREIWIVHPDDLRELADEEGITHIGEAVLFWPR